MSNIENALKAATETNDLIIGSNNLHEVAQLFREQFPGKMAIVIADDNTYRVAGEQVYNELKNANIEQEAPYIFHDEDLYAEYSFVQQLVEALKKHDAIPVTIGSGTLNDLTKLASFQTERRYMCVATAASMDGYKIGRAHV